ncbi:hypothetical protein EYF80_005795 [Liparis tanakae]|uniref:Uncharacterized protein n=1 Tax=Liparis tanakae TaxID=230148 RepID=A0A4Z2J254_9TELE|nr:hypothetical protein EYF80_005795 [Liparis tanakae]
MGEERLIAERRRGRLMDGFLSAAGQSPVHVPKCGCSEELSALPAPVLGPISRQNKCLPLRGHREYQSEGLLDRITGEIENNGGRHRQPNDLLISIPPALSVRLLFLPRPRYASGSLGFATHGSQP